MEQAGVFSKLLQTRIEAVVQGPESEALGQLSWLQTPGVQSYTKITGLHKQTGGGISIPTITRGKSRRKKKEETGTSPKRRQYNLNLHDTRILKQNSHGHWTAVQVEVFYNG